MDKDKELTYAGAVAELEEIVRKMQDDSCDIDNLAAYTSRSLELLRFCKTKLQTADEELKKCLEELG